MVAIEELWRSTQSGNRVFDPARIASLPEPARRYLEHAIQPVTPLASAVRLRSHGEIKLKAWCPFSAEQVIVWGRAMTWQATVKMHGITIRGGDTFIDGEGSMLWKLFGLIPIVNASGPDITRSAAGRVNIESIWLPSALSGDEVVWNSSGPSSVNASFTAHGEKAAIDLTIGGLGELKSVSMPRWGNPGGSEFGYSNCGGFAEREGSFDGYTIPTVMRVGWYFGTDKFESEGEFFRVTIDEAIFR